MNNKQFWQLIEECRNQSNGNKKRYRNIADKKLADLSVDDRLLFNAYVSFYAARAEENPRLMLLGKVIEGSVTDDSILYFALWLVSCGEKVYFETLKNPDKLIELVDKSEFEAGLMPEFEILMTAGKDDADCDDPINIDDAELQLMNQICSERIPKDARTYYDLAREIDAILPNSIRFFDFDTDDLDFSYEAIEQEYMRSIEKLQDETFEKLKKNWTFIQSEIKSYDILKPKRAYPHIIPMPAFNDCVLKTKYKYSSKNDTTELTNCYWHNYKTEEEKEINLNARIRMPGTFRYIAANDDFIYFFANFTVESLNCECAFCIYNFASNTFSYLPLPVDTAEKAVFLSYSLQGGYKKEKSGVFYQNSLYFSIEMKDNDPFNHTYIKPLSLILRCQLQDNTLSVFKKEANLPHFQDDNLYFMDNAECVICENLTTHTEKVVLENVTAFMIEGSRLFFSQHTDSNNYSLKCLHNGNVKDLLTNMPQIHCFSVVGDIIYVSLYISQGDGGLIPGFLLNIKDKTIYEVPIGDQSSDFYLDEHKYFTIRLIYEEEPKVIARVYEVEF
ncbi:hypothetical protein AGMMS50230_15550 [Spirochaetia bacterium]|nr:hypothetical protein AGMMS50230_15550 [Spirochaetia bacterium]